MVCLHSLCTSGEVLTTSIAGLIRFKIVIHCIIDGFSRFILGIGVHDNNRSATVLHMVQTACVKNGYPSRIRADHGVENVDTARWQEEIQGPDRGSFILGRYGSA